MVPAGAFPGITEVFRHLSALGMCAENFEVPLEQLKSGILGYAANPGDLLLFGGWCPPYQRIATRRGPESGVKKYVLWTSAPYQTEAAEIEVRMLEEEIVPMAQRGALDGILFGSRAMADAYEAVIPGRSHWFPYPVDARFPPGPSPALEDRPLTLGMFYPAHHRKNLYAQCLAVRRAMPLITGAKLITNFAPPVHFEAHRVEARSWMPRSTYEGVLHMIRLNLHVTVTESFGYQVVDALKAGAPSLVSDCVFRNLFEADDSFDGRLRSSVETGRVLDFEDLTGLAWMIQRVLPFPEELTKLWHFQVERLSAKAEEHKRRLYELLTQLAD